MATRVPRLLRALLLALVLLLGVLASPALAVPDEDGPPQERGLPSIEEVTTGSEVSQQFLPEAYEQPSVFNALVYPLLVAAFLITFLLMVLYLLWQPRFSREKSERVRR